MTALPPINSSWPRPGEVLRHYQNLTRAIDCLYEEARSSMTVLEEGHRYYGYSIDELDLEFEDYRNELDQQVSLILVASFEAILRLDFVHRVVDKRKDPASKKLRAMARAKVSPQDIRLDHLLDAWKDILGRVEVIGQFKQVVLLRHWLAHGRYWIQKSGLRAIDPLEVWQRGVAVMDAIPILPEIDFGTLEAV